MRRKVLAAIGGLTLLTGTTVATPAQADIYGCRTSHNCVYEHKDFRGQSQVVSGYNQYTEIEPRLHDRVTSWINANRHQPMVLGDWGPGRQTKTVTQHLPPGWVYRHLGDIGFNDKADFVAWN